MENIQKDFEILHMLNTRVAKKDAITKTHEEYGILFKNGVEYYIKKILLLKIL